MINRVWLAAAWLACVLVASSTASVVTYHNSNLRHGAYVVHDLTLAAAATMHRDTRFKATLSGNIYAQPLFWQPKGGGRGVVIVATESNIVYALDHSSGAIVWQRQLATSVPHSELACGNIDPVGITGTPVIDPAAGRLYLDAMSHTVNGPRHLIYALSLADGSIVPNWPLDVQAALAAKGVTFSSTYQGERSALLFFGNNLYVNYAGNAGDCGTYYGTVLQFATDPPALAANWATKARGGGIWAQGGISGDGMSLYVTTGNTFGATSWSDGEAIIRLRPGLARSSRTGDYFTPANWQALDSTDKDLGGTEALPLDVAAGGGAKAKRIIAFGKDGNAYLSRPGQSGRHRRRARDPAGLDPPDPHRARRLSDGRGDDVAFSNVGGQCASYNMTMVNVAASGPTPLSFAWCTPFSGQGAPILTTTDGTSNPIVWVVGAEGDNLLHGFNALNGQTVFSGTGTAMTGLHHFQTILATPNRFYVAADGTVYSFAFGP